MVAGRPQDGAAGPAPAPRSTTAGGGGAAGDWWSGVRQAAQQLQARAQRAGAQLREAGSKWQPPDLSKGLGMRVELDWMQPAITSVKQQWQQLPEPVRDVAPYCGVALAAAAAVQRLYGAQLSLAQERLGQLRADHDRTTAQLRQLEAELQEVQQRRSGARLEVQMAEAVAQATQAAAAAATAAAAAAATATAACGQGGGGWTGSAAGSSEPQQQASVAAGGPRRPMTLIPRFPGAARRQQAGGDE